MWARPLLETLVWPTYGMTLEGDQCSGILCGLDQDTACLFFLIFTLGLGSGSLFDSSDVLCTPPLLACLDSPVFLSISEVIRR